MAACPATERACKQDNGCCHRLIYDNATKCRVQYNCVQYTLPSILKCLKSSQNTLLVYNSSARPYFARTPQSDKRVFAEVADDALLQLQPPTCMCTLTAGSPRTPPPWHTSASSSVSSLHLPDSRQCQHIAAQQEAEKAPARAFDSGLRTPQYIPPSAPRQARTILQRNAVLQCREWPVPLPKGSRKL